MYLADYVLRCEHGSGLVHLNCGPCRPRHREEESYYLPTRYRFHREALFLGCFFRTHTILIISSDPMVARASRSLVPSSFVVFVGVVYSVWLGRSGHCMTAERKRAGCLIARFIGQIRPTAA